MNDWTDEEMHNLMMEIMTENDGKMQREDLTKEMSRRMELNQKAKEAQ